MSKHTHTGHEKISISNLLVISQPNVDQIWMKAQCILTNLIPPFCLVLDGNLVLDKNLVFGNYQDSAEYQTFQIPMVLGIGRIVKNHYRPYSILSPKFYYSRNVSLLNYLTEIDSLLLFQPPLFRITPLYSWEQLASEMVRTTTTCYLQSPDKIEFGT